MNRGAGNRKIARNAFQFQINSGAAFIREWEDHFSQYFVALQRSRIGESKEVFRRDDSPRFRTDAFQFGVQRQGDRSIITGRIGLHQTAADGAAIAHLGIADLACRLAEHGNFFTQQW